MKLYMAPTGRQEGFQTDNEQLVQKRIVQNKPNLYSSVNDNGEYEQSQGFSFIVSRHWPFMVAASVVLALCLSLILVFVIIKRIKRKATSPLNPEPPKQATLPYPAFTIHLTPSSQQPANIVEFARPVETPPQPIRIKAKGLLERRGSNASLTIDLNPVDSLELGTPPKECSTREYLTSAGNRMTRRQLRTCLKDVRILHQEFLDIPLNHPTKLDLPGASNKNRYKSIWPNEETRVRLVDNDGDDYINANYIRGYDGEPKIYIATQGPLVNTVNDFWRMVWLERSPCVVMMTRLREKNRIKCEPYLPTREAVYGNVGVTVRMTTAKNGYYVRDILLKRDNELRQLKHYWFTGWPDQKAPASTAKQLIELAQEVESERQKHLKKSNGTTVGPVMVHCSAGLGRTGCFVATSIGMKQLEEENMVDILGTICQMRLDRGGMIQTVEQYEFVHHALMVYERQLPETPTSAALPLTSSGSHSNSNSSSKASSKNESPVF